MLLHEGGGSEGRALQASRLAAGARGAETLKGSRVSGVSGVEEPVWRRQACDGKPMG